MNILPSQILFRYMPLHLTHSMTSKDYKKTILDKMQDVLRPRQFVKNGQTFKYSNGDLTYYIDLQSSKYSSSEKLTFTVNIGIGSELLYKLEGKTITSHLRGHFSKRIGDHQGLSVHTCFQFFHL